MRILSLSDVVVPFIYSPQVRERFRGVGLVVGCGDLPYYYQEYVFSMLDVPLYYVRGNHDKVEEHSVEGPRDGPMGAVDLHTRVVNYRGLLMAGVEGSVRYREGPFQYSQIEMWIHIIRLIPRMMANKSLYGRYLDVFVTHAPPRGIHDAEDLPHHGIDAFRWFVERFQPVIHFHGHIHLYRRDAVNETLLGKTRVINTYGYRETTVDGVQVANSK
jgi:Icc-related predicted phosphoesterase